MTENGFVKEKCIIINQPAMFTVVFFPTVFTLLSHTYFEPDKKFYQINVWNNHTSDVFLVNYIFYIEGESL